MTTRPSDGRPIFIGGYMHSGTTVLMRALANSPVVYCARCESRFFEMRGSIRRKFPDLGAEEELREYVAYLITLIWNGPDIGSKRALRGKVHEVTDEDLESVLDLIEPHRDHTVIYRRVFDALSALSGEPRWLEKTPANVFHIDSILEGIPDAFVVIAVRDPRDVVSSKKIRRERALKGVEGPPRRQREMRLKQAYDPVLDSLAWRSAARSGRRAAVEHPDSVHLVRYEDFVADPSATVRRLCEFLGLEFKEEMLAVSAHGSATGGTGGAEGPGVEQDRTGRWKKKLSGPELATCQLITSSEMKQAGYSPVSVRSIDRMRIPVLAARSCLDFLGRIYRKLRYGGLGYTRRVIGSWIQRAWSLIR